MPETIAATRFNGHSMVGPLQRVLVCSPQTAGWNLPDRSKQWRELGFLHAPNFAEAQRQHEILCDELRGAGAEVAELAPAPDLTLDAAYTHDASLATDFGLIRMNPGKPNRVAEAKRHGKFAETLGVPTFGEATPPGTTEAGDIVWLDSKTLLIGRSYRTNAAGIDQMRTLLAPKGVAVVTASLPHGQGPAVCLHLMSLISLLDERMALVDLSWLAVETIELLYARGYKLIEIDAAERDTMACNVLALGNHRLLAIEETEGRMPACVKPDSKSAPSQDQNFASTEAVDRRA